MATELEQAFANEGYIAIPFALNGVGQPLIKARLANDTEAYFLLDTGAAINLLDSRFAQTLQLSLTPTGEKGGGAGGATDEIYSLENFSIQLADNRLSFEAFYAMDFSSIREALTSRGVTEEIHGILGFGFFQMKKAFIDYASNRIFVLKN